MNEIEARTVLLVRAFESPPEAPWSAADADAVTREASRDVGADATPAAFITRRAALAADRLAGRDAAFSAALRHSAASLGASLAIVALIGAFAIGFVGDAVGADGRIDILAPPLLVLILWNLAVYAALLVAWLRRSRRPAGTQHPLRAMAADALQRWLIKPHRTGAPWLRFTSAWAQAARSLQTQRITALLHAGAVALACGALASLYLRGLVFEFRAGWDSTFLTPAAVHAWLSLLLAPASWLTRLPIPSAEALALLRFASGNGENAARWIHLWSITVVALVVWPRGWLAAAALLRARRLAGAMPIDLQDSHFQRLLRGRGGASLRVRLLPYSHRPDAAAIARLTGLIEQAGGQHVRLDVADPIPQGDEDDRPLLADRIGADPGVLMILFALAATPERETHGRLLETLLGLDSVQRPWIAIDEGGFARRFASSAPQRLIERRDAWSRMLREIGCTPLFIDLASDAPVTDANAFMVLFEAA